MIFIFTARLSQGGAEFLCRVYWLVIIELIWRRIPLAASSRKKSFICLRDSGIARDTQGN
jgi:hypothetical protein